MSVQIKPCPNCNKQPNYKGKLTCGCIIKRRASPPPKPTINSNETTQTL